MSRPHHPYDAGSTDQAKPLLERPSFLVTVGLIALVAGTIVTLAVTKPDPSDSPPPTAAQPVATAQPVAPTPQPTGASQSQKRPLSDFLSAEEYARFMGDVNAGKTQGSVSLDSAQPAEPGRVGDTQNPSIPNPEPWQYDPVADKHYHAEHGHWHLGPAPSVRDRTPDPWEYDSATDKFWHPGHNHWHQGKPPPPGQRDASPMNSGG